MKIKPVLDNGKRFLPYPCFLRSLALHKYLSKCLFLSSSDILKLSGILQTLFDRRIPRLRHHNILYCIKTLGEWFEPRGISYLFGVIVRVRVVFRKTVVVGESCSDWSVVVAVIFDPSIVFGFV